jgi:DNA topoisomerase-1
MRVVGDELGNTPVVARESYASPVVVDAYLAGRTLEDFRRATARPRQLSADERAPVRMLRAASRWRRTHEGPAAPALRAK